MFGMFRVKTDEHSKFYLDSLKSKPFNLIEKQKKALYRAMPSGKSLNLLDLSEAIYGYGAK